MLLNTLKIVGIELYSSCRTLGESGEDEWNDANCTKSLGISTIRTELCDQQYSKSAKVFG